MIRDYLIHSVPSMELCPMSTANGIVQKINPTLKPDANGIVYLKCIKALYGHIEAARLFYNDLNKNIQEKMNFQQNRYDPCVYNKKTPHPIDGVGWGEHPTPLMGRGVPPTA
jgi:hypothetical protein